jgi:23S rRNA (uracil1939-C5)-methyltransferase
MLSAGEEIELAIEKPASGGRMIARHEGQIVLVAGAIPGERVVATVERADRRLAFASVSRILEPSPSRRSPAADPLCGGCLYAHIDYAAQPRIKSEVIADAFSRLGHIPLEQGVAVAPSPEHGYRLRARLHVNGARVGFYRENTHTLCDAAATRQLGGDTVPAATAAVKSLVASGMSLVSVEISENIAADQRVLHAEGGAALPSDASLDAALSAGELTGLTVSASGTSKTAGVPVVADPLSALVGGEVPGELSRQAESFFQANRFLLPRLVSGVLGQVLPDGPILDLYAGVGLFSVCLAASGREGITAVEGDRTSGTDLRRNAAAHGAAVRVVLDSVEDHLRRGARGASTIVVDPPRTGISKQAVELIARHRARRIVYVSCDPPTMARDARRLLDGGYRLTSLTGFDLFPNTPHVESVGVFDLA